jgi:DNA-directed RNA polymerase subunit RPC12/RpoP
VITDFDYLHCDYCNGIIHAYNREKLVYTCDMCGKRFELSEHDYDELRINKRAGFIIPVKFKR